jgi:dolichyl-phosphate beta-glucosyltransferase
MPAHNEESRLPPSLEKIDAFLKTQAYEAEVIVVENGSHDRTAEITEAFAATHPYVRLMVVNTRGKGLAVKAGMLEARGEYRFICDVDLSMPIEEIVHFLPPTVDGFDILIGSREGKGARRIGEPAYRHLMGRVNNWIIKLAAVRGFEDTQCGFKMFGRRAAEDLFNIQRMNGIGFDVELLFIAQKRGYRICEVPITWYFDPDSKMRLVQDSLNMLLEIWDIRQNWRKGLYAIEEKRHRQLEV